MRFDEWWKARDKRYALFGLPLGDTRLMARLIEAAARESWEVAQIELWRTMEMPPAPEVGEAPEARTGDSGGI